MANLKQIARAIEKCPDQATADLVAWFIPRAEKVGGRFRFAGGKSYKMGARLKTRKGGRAVLVGIPPGGWAIKSYGRRGHYDVRARSGRAVTVPGGLFARVTIDRATGGDNRWSRLVDEAETKFVDVFVDRIHRAVR